MLYVSITTKISIRLFNHVAKTLTELLRGKWNNNYGRILEWQFWITGKSIWYDGQGVTGRKKNELQCENKDCYPVKYGWYVYMIIT